MHDGPRLEPISKDGIDLLIDPGAVDLGWLVAFSSRWGGVSSAPYDTLNLAARGGDRAELVAENRRRVAAACDYEAGSLALARQVHGAAVLEAKEGESGVLGQADVLLTRVAGPVLGVLTADCAAVLLVGDNGAAVAHAGWRGLAAGVVENAVACVAPVRAAWIGPCIRACCYEVGAEVIAAFQDAGLPIAAPGRVDPAEAAAFALRRAGVEAIALTSVCTSCSPDYFSYRRDGVTGRQGAFLGLLA